MSLPLFNYDREMVDAAIERVLSAPKYGHQASNPFADELRRWWFRFLDWLDGFISSLPGGVRAFWGLLTATVLTLAVVAAFRLGRRRNTELEAFHLGRRATERGLDPAGLEQQAARAATAGDYREAVRLRYLVGLLRLDERHAIEYRPGITGTEVSERLADSDYENLAADFDAIVYGDRPARSEDDDKARRSWARVLERSR